jgi:hypothetical protein
MLFTFDWGGTISSNTDVFEAIIVALSKDGHEVSMLTGMARTGDGEPTAEELAPRLAFTSRLAKKGVTMKILGAVPDHVQDGVTKSMIAKALYPDFHVDNDPTVLKELRLELPDAVLLRVMS